MHRRDHLNCHWGLHTHTQASSIYIHIRLQLNGQSVNADTHATVHICLCECVCVFLPFRPPTAAHTLHVAPSQRVMSMFIN